MLKLIYGHSGCGKSSLIYNMMKNETGADKRSYLIVPEQETVRCERKLLDILPPSSRLTHEVLNFSRLANLVFRSYGGLSYNYADKAAKTLIMWKNLRDLSPFLSEFSGVGKRNGISAAEEMLATVSELKAYCVTPAKMEAAAKKLDGNPILQNKLIDLSLISSAYSNHLEESFSDVSDDLSHLAEKLDEHDFFRGADVYVDSFTSFTGQEWEVLERIIKQADSVTVALTVDSVHTSCIHYQSAAETALKLRHVAKKLSSELEEIHLGECRKDSVSLKAISESLWSHSVSNLTAEDAQSRISIIKAKDPYEESEAIANHIRYLMMRGVRCKDIAVIARDASIYRGIIDTALEKARIPYFFSQSTDIMSKAPVKFIVSALKIKINNWRREDVIAYLKTDLLGFDRRDVDIFECYASTWNLRGKAFTGEDFTMNPGGYTEYFSESSKMLLERVNSLKNTFVPPLIKLFARLDSAYDATDMCRAIYLFMEENGLASTIKRSADADYEAGRRKEASESLQLYNSIIKSLENIASILGDESISVKEFYDSLKIMLSNTSIGTIPTAEDQVTVGSASMLRTSNVKCVLIMGLCEGEFPQSIKDTGIFSDNDKKILEDNFDIFLSARSEARASDELFYVYRAMSSPSDSLALFYHSEDASGEQALPSMAIERIKSLFPTVKERAFSELPHELTMLSPDSTFEKLRSSAPSPYLAAARDYFAAHPDYSLSLSMADAPSTNANCTLSKSTAEGVFGQTLGLTQTIIDNYADCPFEYMCKKLLRLSEGDRAEFDYSNFGTYIHYIFEYYVKTALADGFIGKDPDRQYIESVVDRAASEYLQKISIGNMANAPRLAHRFARMRRLAVLVATNITREFADSSFRPEFFELSIGKSGNGLSLAPYILPINDRERIALTGKIDRVDLLHRGEDVYVRVIDYKSGSKTFSEGDLKQGKNVQLPLYLFSLCDKDQTAFREAIGSPGGSIIPAGAMYLSSLIKPVDIFDSTLLENVRDIAESSIDRSGFLLDDEEILLEMSHSFSKQYLCGITKTKTGKISGDSRISSERMTEMNGELKETVIRIGSDIMDGKMSPSPSLVGSELHCKNCAMRAVCRAASKFGV